MTEAHDNSSPRSPGESQPMAETFSKAIDNFSSLSNPKAISDSSNDSSISSLETLVLTPSQSASALPLISPPQETPERDTARISKIEDEVEQENARTTLSTAIEDAHDNLQELVKNGLVEADVTVIATRGCGMICTMYKANILPYFRFFTEAEIEVGLIMAEHECRTGQIIKVNYYDYDHSHSEYNAEGFMPEPSPDVEIIPASDSSEDRLLYSQVWPVGKTATFLVKRMDTPVEAEDESPAENVKSPRPPKDQTLPFQGGLYSASITPLAPPFANPLPMQNISAEQHPATAHQHMHTQPIALNPAPMMQGPPAHMPLDWFPQPAMHAAGMYSGGMHARPSMYAPPRPMGQQVGQSIPLGPQDLHPGMAQLAPQNAPSDHALPPRFQHPDYTGRPSSYGPHSGMSQPGYPLPLASGAIPGLQQPGYSMSIPYNQRDEAIDEAALPWYMRPRHQGKDGTTFIRAPGQEIVLLPDGTYIDYCNVMIATQFNMDKELLKRLEQHLNGMGLLVHNCSECKPCDKPQGQIRFRTFISFRARRHAECAIQYLRGHGGIAESWDKPSKWIPFLRVEYHKPNKTLMQKMCRDMKRSSRSSR